MLDNPKAADVHAGLGAFYGIYADALQKAGGDLRAIIRTASLSVKEQNVALALDENCFMARLGRAIHFSFIPGGFRQAEEDFQKLIQMQKTGKFPWFPYDLAYLYFGLLYERAGQPDRARELWQQGAKLYPKSTALERALARLEQPK